MVGPPTVPLTKPRLGGELSVDAKTVTVGRPSRAELLAQTALIAGLYGLGTYAIAPLAFGPVQIRITDALLPISWNRRVGLSGALGVTLGVIASNVISPFGFPDLVIGTLANAVVGLLAYWLGRWQSTEVLVLAALQASVVVAFLVGVVLLGGIYSFDPVATFASVLAGELVSCVALGVPLTLAIKSRYR